MNALLPLAVGVPILGAAISTALRSTRPAQRVLTVTVTVALVAVGVALSAATVGGTVVVERVGGWPAPFAINFAADPFSALMLTVAMLTVTICIWFATAAGQDDHPLFHPLVLVLVAGTANALLTADLFNLFVAFEVMLIASYVLLVLQADAPRLRAGAVYVTTNLVASALFVVGIGLVYGLTGSVNFGAMAVDVRAHRGLLVPGVVLLVAFSVKAALVPVHGWLARSYPAAPPAVTALFSALLTKVGVYALYRVYSLLFADVPGMRAVALVVAGASMLVGVLGAVGRDSLRAILSFHMTSQMGYMVMGLGLFGVGGLTAGIFFILHQILVKTSLFLSAGAVERLAGTGRLDRLGGLGRAHPALAVAFGLAALSLAGLPPLSGFFGKLLLIEVAFVDGQWLIAGVAILVSLYTLTSMVKIWNATFFGDTAPAVAAIRVLPGWGRPAIAGGADDGGAGAVSRWGMVGLVGAPLTLAVISLGLGLGAEGLYRLSLAAGEMLADPSVYVDAILGGGS